MSLKHLLSKTVTDLEALKGFSFGAGKPHTAEQYGVGDVPAWIPSGITLLDYALGGGLPLGRMSELFSEHESEGKTTLALHFAIQCQKAGGLVVWLESEAALDRPRAELMGLKLQDTIIFGPPTLEDGFAFIDQIIRNVSEDKELQGCPILIVWDTIAAAPTKADKDGDPFAGGMTEAPRIISRNLRRYVQEFFKYKVHLCLVNQSYTNVAAKNAYVPQFITPGGKAIKFYASLRIKCRKSGWAGEARNLETGDQRTGIVVSVSAVKNKLALPFQQVDLYLYGKTGYDNIMSMAEYFLNAKNKACIDQRGAWLNLPGDVKAQWKTLRETVQATPAVLELWKKAAAEVFSLPVNREPDPKTGWITRKPGHEVVESVETEEKPEDHE